MELIDTARKYFGDSKVMQVGTLHHGQPRVNSVYYVVSDNCRAVYWMSEPHRRHSKDIEHDNHVAGAVATKTDWPVAGLQFTGVASIVDDIEEMTIATEKYNQKYNNAAQGFVERFQSGKNKHLFYKIVLTSLEIFDQEKLGDNPVAVSFD